MSNKSDFLQAFNDIEHNLRERAGADREEPFGSLLRQLGHHRVIKQYKKRLQQLAGLRNILVHHSGPDIAEPTKIAVETLLKVYRLLEEPPTVLDIATRFVAKCTHDTSIREVLVHMEKNQFNYIPVYREHELIGIFSSESVRRWMTAKVEDRGFIVEDCLVSDLIPYLDPLVQDDFVAKSEEAFVIEGRFKNDAKRRVEMLFVTENGRIGECLMGIMTTHDLIKWQQ